jgi:hypothetical protein
MRLNSRPGLLLLWLLSCGANGAPQAQLWQEWLPSADTATVELEHTEWQQFIDLYLRPGSDGINRVDYAGVNEHQRHTLETYLERLQAQPVSRLTRSQQLAYWINLYNAGTVAVILQHYPVASIRDIDTSPGWFSDGPWGEKRFDIESRQVSLDDIEHRILRPIWQDPRLHYALNCASIGCPNLQPRAFSAENAELLLQQGARDYVNHPRGARVEAGKLRISSIYRWFQSDFGGNDAAVISHLHRYAEPALRRQLENRHRIDAYGYDWALNAAP